MTAPTPVIQFRDLEGLMDGYGYLLSTDPRTSGINWILGDVGMGSPSSLPFGYISVMTETVTWYTANGGQGGLAAGLDDWMIPISLTVAFEPHRFVDPVPAAPPSDSPYNPANNAGFVPTYMEQPGWRKALQINQDIKKVLRTNITIGAAATDTRIVESRYILQVINNQLYRAARTSVQSQQRRTRGS